MGANNINKKAIKTINPQDTNDITLLGFSPNSDLPVLVKSANLLNLTATPTLDEVLEENNVATTSITATSFSDSNGAIKPYKSFVALISQSGTSIPTAITLENNFGVTVSFTRSTPGVYTLVLNGAFPVSDKVFHILESLTNTTYELDILNLNQLIIVTTDAAGTPTDGLLNKRCLEIRVYN